jgi:hypothetical protein
MNWVKENKFLTTFFAVMFVGVLALGYLLYSAHQRYRDAQTQYEEQSTELNRLQGLAPYPAAPNVEKIEAQRKEHQAAVIAMQKALAAAEFPLEPMSEVQFQDKLRESVTRVTAKAAERGMTIADKEKFYMGFALYETQPPRVEAAPLLGRQLKAIEFVLMQLIDNRVSVLTKLVRPELPEEKEKRTGSSTTSPGDDRRPEARGERRSERGETELVSKQSFDIAFLADQEVFRNVLNNLVGNKTQFLIPRVLEVKNEQEKAPSRTETGVAAAPPPAAAETAEPAVAAAAAAPPTSAPGTPRLPGTPAAAAARPGAPAPPPPPPAEALRYLVGAEKLEVGMRLEIVDFVEPAAPAAPAAAAAPGPR